MSTQTLTRTISITHGKTYPTVTFRRFIGLNDDCHPYTIECCKMTEKQLQRIDRLTFAAHKTSCMTFNHAVIVTSSFWKEVDDNRKAICPYCKGKGTDKLNGVIVKCLYCRGE